MGELLELSLGIMTAVGGFVDVSELVFAAQAGARFQYALIWVFAFSTIGIIVFGEMSGRVAAIAKQPVFALMRQRLGLKLGLVALGASLLVNLITCAAEIGGIAFVLQLLTGLPFALLTVAATLFLVAVIWILPFKWIERMFGLLGLFMIVFGVATCALDPPWPDVAKGFIPNIPSALSTRDTLAFAYFTVAILSAVMFPYEVYFYSSGAIEEHWSKKDLPNNRLTTYVGFVLGSLMAIALLVNSAVLFKPQNINPEMIGTVAMQAISFGRPGIIIALAGMFFAVAGAGIETCLSNAYSLSQFFGWEWGRYEKPWDAPRFTFAWLINFLLAMLLVLTGISVIDLVEYAVVFSVLVLPLTYLPLLLTASDRGYMHDQVNGRLSTILGWFYFVLLCIAGVAALPLFFLTAGGKV